MSDLASLPNYVTPTANLGSLIMPNFKVPEFHPIIPNPPPVMPYGQIADAIGAGITAHQQREDTAAARESAKVANIQYLRSQGVDTSNLTATPEPGPLSRLAGTLGHTLDGTLGEHGNDPKPASPLANLAGPDPTAGAFSVGPGGATFQPFRRDPAQDDFTRAQTRRITAEADAAEATRKATATPPTGTVDPFTGKITGAGSPTAPTGASGDLPSGEGAAKPAALTALGGTVNVRSTTYFPGEKHSDPDTDAGRTSTGGPLVPATPTMAGTVAVDPAKYPYGTIFRRPDGSVYVAADTGGAVKSMKASGGKADVLDFASATPLPDWENVQVIPPQGNYTKMTAAEKATYHRQAAAFGPTPPASNPPPATPTVETVPAPAAIPPTPAPVPALASDTDLPFGLGPFPSLAALSAATPPGAASVTNPLAGTPAPLTLAPTAKPLDSTTLANLAGPLALADASPRSAPLAIAPLPGLPPTLDVGPAVGAPERPVLKALPVNGPTVAPVDSAPAPGSLPAGFTLLPNGNILRPDGATLLNPAVAGMERVFRRTLPDGTTFDEPNPAGNLYRHYVKPAVVADAVLDPATGQPVPGVLMRDNQFVTRQPPAGKAGAAGTFNIGDLTTEQQFQARALASDAFGKKVGNSPETVNLVADLLRQGKDRNDIRAIAAQVSPTLRVASQYNSDPQVKTYLNTVANYQTVKDITEKPEASRTMQDDLSLLFAYVKADNPTMGVTEGSFRTAAEQGTYGDQIKRTLNQLTNTNQRLTLQQVEGFRDAALSKLIGQRQTYELSRQRYSGLAEGVGADADTILGPDVKPFTEEESRRARGLPAVTPSPAAGASAPSSPAAASSSPAPPAAGARVPPPAAVPVTVNSQEDYNRLPSGTLYVDSQGKTGRKR